MNTKVRLAMAAAAVAAMLSTAGCNKLKARDQLNQGVNAYRNAKYEEAIEHFKNAVGLDENLKYAKLYLATAYMQQYLPGVETADNIRNAQMAVQGFKEVLSREPHDITSLKSIAYLYLNMKKYDESRDYYQKTIEADPNDPEAYYSVGVLDWSAVYRDTADRKAKNGLRVEDEMKNRQDLKLCDEIRNANQGRLDEGIKMLEIARSKRQDYDDAMSYLSLLYRRKADIDCGNPRARGEDLKEAENWSNSAMAARKKKAEEAARKTNAGIVLEATPTPNAGRNQ
jgi:tetratricopeptide (TPR) repeat protein